MHFSIKNLGIVKSAEIELNGLAVLTGYNDCGKSFIGKMIYSIITTIKNAVLYEEDARIDQIAYNLNRVKIFRYRVSPPNVRVTGLTFNLDSLHGGIDDRLSQFKLHDSERLLDLINTYKIETLEELERFNQKNSRIKKEDLPSIKIEIEKHFELINTLINASYNDEILYINYFQTVIINEMFGGEINSLMNDDALEMKIIEGSTILLSLLIEHNRITSFKYKAIELPLFKTDCILIETPTFLVLDKYFLPIAHSQFRERDLPLQYQDLLLKIFNKNKTTYPASYQATEDIQKIIGGNVAYDATEREIVFDRNDNSRIGILNVATGIKSFGLLQTLFSNGYLNPDTILIIDEPEVHLHPAWEVAYAKIILGLINEGISIIISTHSSYILSTLNKYSKDMNLEDKVHYYYGQKESTANVSIFNEFDLKDNPIWKTMSKPMRDLM